MGASYPPILAGDRRWEASLIAFAGPGIGNGAIYAACFVPLRREMARLRRIAAMLLFWLAVMSAGNVWSYAPMRTVTT